jgi:uncharacterized membrane protein
MKPARPAVAAALLGQAATAAFAVPPHYRIVDLGVVGTAMASQAFGVSEDGTRVVGRDLGSGSNPAFSWKAAGGRVALPNLAGRSCAQANGVNDAGLIVGTAVHDGPTHACAMIVVRPK